MIQTVGKCVDNCEVCPTSSRNDMNFATQTASNWTCILPTLRKFCVFLPGFADGEQQTELNQTVPNGGW